MPKDKKMPEKIEMAPINFRYLGILDFWVFSFLEVL